MSDATRTTGTAMIEALEANGVSLVFGVPGTHNLELYRGINQSSITHVVPRHEQGAAYAADGYTRSTGRPGVVITTSGPGLTNALTGMTNAYADSIPMLVISPGIPTGQERLDFGWLHEVKDQRTAVDNLVTRSVRPGTPQQAIDAIHETFARWAVERPRPVHLEIPLDVLELPWEGEVPPAWPRPHAPAPSPGALAAVLAALGAASRVVIFAGGGSVDASAAITSLAIALDAPVITTTLGKGVLDEQHPLAVGEFSGSPGTAGLVAGADVVLAFGTELGGFARYPEFGGTLVRFDIDTAQLQKNVRADIAITSDSRLGAEAILALLPSGAAQRGGAELAQSARLACLADMEPRSGKWRSIQAALREALPDDVVITGDSSQVSYMGTGPYWQFPSPRNYLVTTGYSTLGYALPAAIGAKLADRDRPVVALLGDGALMFSIQEFVTAAEVGLALPVVIVDNHGFGEIRENMVDRDIQPLAVTLARPDFAALAQAMNCHGVVVATESEAAQAAVEALGADRPTLIILEVGE